MSLPPVLNRWFQSFKRWCKKYESVISVIFSVSPTIGTLVSKVIVKRVLASLLGLSAVGLVGLTNQEDFRAPAYKDDAGVPTIGFGSTKGVKMGDTITVRQALTRLSKEVKDEYEVGFHKLAGDIPMYQHEYDVYLRVIYNIGPTAFRDSTMLRLLKQGDYDGACAAIKLFNKITVSGKKVKSRGLANLREEQYKECMEEPT